MTPETDAAAIDDGTLVMAGLSALEDLSIVFFDREMRIRAVRGGAAERHGYLPERIVGRRAPDVLPALAWERLEPLYTRALTGETVTVRLPSADGAAVYETTFQPVRRGGELIGGMATSRDVSGADELDRLRVIWQQSFDRSTVGVTVIDPDSHLMVKVNPAFAAMHGGRVEDFEGRHLGTTFAPEERERIATIAAQTLADGYVAYTADHIRLDGSRFPTETEAIAARDADGRLLYRLGYFRDVTTQVQAEQERRRAEEELRRAAHDFKVLAESTRDIVSRSRPDGEILYVSPAFARLSGRSADGLNATGELPHIHPEDVDRLRSERAAVIVDGRSRNVSYRMLRPDGTAIWVESELRRATGLDGETEMHATTRDITARVEAEAALARSESDFRLLAEHSTDVITRSRLDGESLYMSPAVETLLGLPVETYTADQFYALLVDEDRERLATARAATVADGTPRQVEFRIDRPDGQRRWIQADLRILADPATGEALELHAAARDVTERREAEELQRRWELVFETVGRGVVWIDPDTGCFIRVNPAAAAMHGGTPEDYIGRPLASVFAPASLGKVAEVARRIEEDGTAIYDSEHVREDGTTFPVRAEVFTASDDDGRLLYRLAFLDDLSEVQAREGAERRATERFEQSFEHAPVGMMLLRSGRILRANATIAEWMGVTPDALAGRDPLEFTHPDDHAVATASLAQTAAGGPQTPQERRIVTPDGRELRMHFRYSILDAGEEQPTVLVHVLDRTAEAAVAHARDEALALFETTFDRAPTGVCLVGPDGRFLRVNAALCSLMGRDEATLLSTDFQELTHPADLTADLDLLTATIAGERDGYELDKRYLRPDGSVIAARLAVSLVRDAAGAPSFFISQIVDLSEQRAAQADLADLQARTQAILDNSPLNIFSRDMDGHWLLANRSLQQVLGHSEEELRGMDLAQTYGVEAARQHAEQDRRVLAEGRPLSYDVVQADQAHGGEERHFWVQKFPVTDASGSPIGIGGIALDVTDRERTQRALGVARERFAVAFEHAPVGKALCRVGDDGQVAFAHCNPAYAEMLGHTPESLLGVDPRALVHGSDHDDYDRTMAATQAGRAPRTELRLAHADGHWVWVLLAPAILDDGAELVMQALDITERKRFEEQLRRLADHDALTGQVNRRRFAAELDREVARVRRHGGRASLLLLDLDGFKFVNDAFGHPAGDDLLVRITGALAGALREGDVLGRIGGDEFAVLLPGTDAEGGRRAAMKLVGAVREHGVLLRADRRAAVTASVGLTTLDGRAALAGEELLVEADIAMYQAKEAGKDQVVRYDRAGQHREQITRRTDWIGRLREAVRADDLVLHAQPVVPLDPGAAEPGHHELLLRLRDGDELIAPGAFLYHAERDGLIAEIDRWVLCRATQTLAAARADGRELRLSVNLSGRTLQEPGIVDHIAALLERSGVPGDALTIELTETAAITNVTHAAELSRRLQALGCRVALDDFGAGFASFYYLKHLVFDELKIDGEFVERLPHSPTDQLIVRAVVDIAAGLGATVVAERVTDQATVDLLRTLGVGYGQGHFLGRPGPLT